MAHTGKTSDQSKPAFLITIDTEGDNLWSRGSEITTRNAAFLPRFQDLCETYGLKPTYLTNYEMAIDPAFVTFAKSAEEHGNAEVGMHLHAWNSPPLDTALTTDDNRFHPYLIEFSEDRMREKISFMTRLLEDTFGHAITSHRAGRWSFDERYARLLTNHGYLVDCSLTPHVSWAANKGDPAQIGGSDFRHCPEDVYWMDLDDVTRPGDGPLLQVPMTVAPRFQVSQRMLPGTWLKSRWGQRIANRLLPNDWLRPKGGNADAMISLARARQKNGHAYAMFMTHSSELMPGGSHYFPTEQHIEQNYRDLEKLFSFVSEHFRGMTMSGFAHEQTSSVAAKQSDDTRQPTHVG